MWSSAVQSPTLECQTSWVFEFVTQSVKRYCVFNICLSMHLVCWSNCERENRVPTAARLSISIKFSIKTTEESNNEVFFSFKVTPFFLIALKYKANTELNLCGILFLERFTKLIKKYLGFFKISTRTKK